MKELIQVGMISAMLMTSTSVFAANSNLPNGPYLIADGSATYEAPPDFVKIEFSVSKTAPTTAAASTVVDKKTETILKVLREYKIPDKDIRASSVSVSPDYDYSGEKQVYKGQEVTRNFKITLNNLTDYSAFTQALLKSDIDSISNITFGTSHYSEYEDKVMKLAISDAHDHAMKMANQVGATLGKAYAISTGDYKSFLENGFPLQGVSDFASPLPNAVPPNPPPPPPPPPGYVVPKSITISYGVTIVYSMAYSKQE